MWWNGCRYIKRREIKTKIRDESVVVIEAAINTNVKIKKLRNSVSQ